MNDNEYICIRDTYFKLVKNKKGSYYTISDKDLAKLIVEVRCLENEMDVLKKRHKNVYDGLMYQIKMYKNKCHIYKIELGRCVRKLTRIYALFDSYRLESMKRYPITDIRLYMLFEAIDKIERRFRNV